MSFDFFDQENGAALLNAARHPSTTPDTGAFENFWSGTGNYAMRSLAEAGRAVSMAGAAFPVALDAVVGSDNLSGKPLADQYFKKHDAIFNGAVDHWTPKPGEVGTAGQIAGQLAGGVMQAIISPALLVATSQLSSAEDLVREGVDASTANTVGAVQGAAAAVGVKMPTIGSTLATRILSGAGGNLAQGMGAAAASKAILESSNNTGAAAQFDPLDLRGRMLDVMLGAAFGGMAHIEAKLTPTDQAALLVANQARHLEEVSQGRPATDADATMHAEAMRQAVSQVLNGDAVTVDQTVLGMKTVADEGQFNARHEVMTEAHGITESIAPHYDPVQVKTQATALGISTELSTTGVHARRVIAENPDMVIATGIETPDGSVHTMRAADAINLAEAELAFVQSRGADLFKTAAHCLLGAL